MTDKELFEQALEALEIECKGYNDKVVRNRGIITALRDRLAQPEQEPVAWMHPSWADSDTRGWASESFKSNKIDGWTPLYTAPPQRLPLTDEEVREGCRKADPDGEDLCAWSFEQGVRFAEAAHGIKE